MWDGDNSDAPLGGGEYGRYGPPATELFARLTATRAATLGSVAGQTVYEWVQVLLSDPAFPDDVAADFALVGTADALPAVEIHGRLDVPTGDHGEKVRLYLAPSLDYYVFAAGVPAGWELARVVSGTDAGGYTCNGIYLAGRNIWFDTPGLVYRDCYRAPSNEVYALLPTIPAGQSVLIRPSPTLSGKYEITPWGGQLTVTWTSLDADCKQYTNTLRGRDLVFSRAETSPSPPSPPVTIQAKAVGYDPPSGPYRVGKNIDFAAVDVSGGAPAYSYAWDFGDGGTGTGQTVSHTYSAAGTYTPTLLVGDTGTGTSGFLNLVNGDGSGVYTITGDTTRQQTVAVVKTQFDKTNNTLADVTGLSADVAASTWYAFRAVLSLGNAGGSAGYQWAIGGTCTRTTLTWASRHDNSTSRTNLADDPVTALGTPKSIAAGPTAATVTIEGAILVDAAGTLTVEFAQSTTQALDKSSALVGSTFTVTPVSS